MIIDISKNNMVQSFVLFCEEIFAKSEIESISVKDVIIRRDNLRKTAENAFNAGYHDAYSDIDMTVKVILPKDGSVGPDEYMKRIERFGISEDNALGRCFVPENNVYRIILKNGMRYDLIFSFEYGDNTGLQLEEPCRRNEENDKWPLENINRFWFVQIQALAKLYRKDYLISGHLANINCNDTLVMQMIMRDIKYGSNHHRYGYSEKLEYTEDLGKCVYKTGDPVFDRIADQLYAAALTYDRLAKNFYPDYLERSNDFLAIWDAYESYRKENVIQTEG